MIRRTTTVFTIVTTLLTTTRNVFCFLSYSNPKKNRKEERHRGGPINSLVDAVWPALGYLLYNPRWWHQMNSNVKRRKQKKKLDIRPLMDIKEKRATSFEKNLSVFRTIVLLVPAQSWAECLARPPPCSPTCREKKRTLALLVFHHFPVVFETIRYVWPRSHWGFGRITFFSFFCIGVSFVTQRQRIRL